MSIRVSVLSSGSGGNATFIRTDTARMLIDCGLGPKTLANRLRTIGEDPDQIDVVLITHEHSDHVAGLKSMVEKYSLDVFMSGGTMDGSRADSFDMNGPGIVPIVPGQSFTVGDVEIDTVRVPHDAREPTAFSVRYKGIKVTQLTDLGWIPDHVADWMKGSHILILQWGLLGVPDTGFDFAFAVWIAHPAWHGHHAVMGQDISKQRIQGGVVMVRDDHAFAQVIQHDEAGSAAESAERGLVQLGPDGPCCMDHPEGCLIIVFFNTGDNLDAT